jgi:hypothetical protein
MPASIEEFNKAKCMYGSIVMLMTLQRPLRCWPISALAEAQLLTGPLKSFMVHGRKNTWIGRQATKADAIFPG